MIIIMHVIKNVLGVVYGILRTVYRVSSREKVKDLHILKGVLLICLQQSIASLHVVFGTTS